MLAKSKLNSIETLIYQALIDIEISHKECITILKEKDKYERMKDILKIENEKCMSNNTSCKAMYNIMRLSRDLQLLHAFFKNNCFAMYVCN